MNASLTTLERASLVCLVGASASLGGAWVFEFGLGYLPCALCLEQRVPYYFGIPLAFAAVGLTSGGYRRQAGLALLAFAVLFAYGAGLGAYHSGIEWRWWAGPADCSPTGGLELDAAKLLEGFGKTKPPSCIDAALRIFGLSLAGYNALISAGLAALAVMAGYKARFISTGQERG